MHLGVNWVAVGCIDYLLSVLDNCWLYWASSRYNGYIGYLLGILGSCWVYWVSNECIGCIGYLLFVSDTYWVSIGCNGFLLFLLDTYWVSIGYIGYLLGVLGRCCCYLSSEYNVLPPHTDNCFSFLGGLRKVRFIDLKVTIRTSMTMTLWIN